MWGRLKADLKDKEKVRTLVKSILILLALLAATGHALELVHEATAAGGGGGSLGLVLGALGLLVAASELVEHIHLG